MHADDGIRLCIDHKLLIDSWNESSDEKKAYVILSKDEFHDIKLEYKEETGNAFILLQWSSNSIQKQVIPATNMYHATHISGSPFSTEIVPGAADYPFSDFVLIEGKTLTEAVAGERNYFIIQSKDSMGNNKLDDSPDEQFVVEIVGSSSSLTVSYMHDGQYKVEYLLLKARHYKVHVRTGGTDIYCGLGEKNKCSPFDLIVRPGQSIASMCEAESNSSVDSLVKAIAGEIGVFTIQAKDSFGNNRDVGGYTFLAKFSNIEKQNIE